MIVGKSKKGSDVEVIESELEELQKRELALKDELKARKKGGGFFGL